jgi:hypothetical protein
MPPPSSPRIARTLGLPLLLTVGLVGLADAQSDVARAQDLFVQGKRLMAQKQLDDACPKFAESARLDRSSGVVLALGICYEAQGKTASAWGAFTEALSLARRDGRHDRETVATTRARALESQLSRATIVLAAADTSRSGLEVKEDAAVLGSVSWKDAPVDPGSHTLEVTAPGFSPYKTTFNTAASGATVTVTVPPLEPLPEPASAPAVVASPSEVAPPVVRKPTVWRPVGIASMGVGAAGLSVGAILGALAIGKVSDVHRNCPTNPCPNASAVSDNQSAGQLADASTGAFIAGGVLAAAGILMFTVAPSSRTEAAPAAPAALMHPVLGPGYAGVGGSF